MTQNKNDGNEKLINSLLEICDNNNKKIIELETKLINLENNYKNNKETAETKIKTENNSNNTQILKIILKRLKIEEMNKQVFKKFDEITQEINKKKNDIFNKKFEKKMINQIIKY